MSSNVEKVQVTSVKKSLFFFGPIIAFFSVLNFFLAYTKHIFLKDFIGTKTQFFFASEKGQNYQKYFF